MAQISESVSPFTNLKSSDSSITNHRRGNMWEDDRIQSLNSPYGAPAYQERSEKLIEEIKLLFLSDMDDSCNDSDHDLIKRLEIVDTVECLGIDRHFQPEIKVALDYVYRCWNERGIGEGSRDSLKKDLNATALGFRALRLHRYNVSSGVLENFRDDNGQFFCGSTVEEEGAEAYNKHVRCMLSLSRASDILFPGEKVMEEAKAFTANYLKKVLAGREATHVDESLLGELNSRHGILLYVKYALEFPWHCSVQRWESRSFIEIYGQIDSELKSNLNKKILELAKLDFNILQYTHQKKVQIISRWFADSIIAPLNFYRKCYVELYFWMAAAISEPEFSGSRIAFTKIGILVTILDDLYDTHGTLDKLKIFTEGVRRWDASLVEGLPDYMKIAFEFWLKTANELIAEAVEAVKGKGQDMAAYIRKNADAWERFLGAYLQDAEWIASGHIPTFDEYLKNGAASTGMSVLIVIPLLLMGQVLPLDILEQIDFPSRFHHLLELGGRLVDDSRDFQVEKDHGDLSCIDCYLKDHPESTVEDALNHVNGLLRNCVVEMNWEFLKQDSVPLPSKKFTSHVLARSTQFIYMLANTNSDSANAELKTEAEPKQNTEGSYLQPLKQNAAAEACSYLLTKLISVWHFPALLPRLDGVGLKGMRSEQGGPDRQLL